jgi:hypothetical protein
MSYRPSNYMLKRRRSVLGLVVRGFFWTISIVLGLVGIGLLAAAPITETLIARALSARGLGPVEVDVTRLDPGGVSLRGLSVQDGAAKIGELDVTFDWREALQGRINAVRIDGLTAKLSWAADGTIKLGQLQLYPPLPATQPSTATPPTPPDAAPPEPKPVAGPPLRNLSISNSAFTLALPSGDVVLPLAVTAAQDAQGRALDAKLSGTGAGVELKVDIGAVERTGQPAQGAAVISYTFAGLDLPGVANALTGDGVIDISFDPQGTKAQNSRADLALVLPALTRLSALGIDATKPVKLSLGAGNARTLLFTIDRTLPSARATLDFGLGLAQGPLDIRLVAKGWSDVPVANTKGEKFDPQDFHIERLGLTARKVPVMGGDVDASVALIDFKGPVALAEGRMAAEVKSTTLPAIADRLEANLATGFRLDGLSMSFDLTDLRLDAENLKLGSAMAQGLNRAELNRITKAAQQVNVVFSSAGGVTLTSDLVLAATLPRILTEATDPGAGIASLAIPQLMLGGYITQRDDGLTGQIKINLADGRLTHPVVGLGDLAATLQFNGKALTGPLSARLIEAPDPSRPKALDRRGAELQTSLNIDSDSIDIKGKIVAGTNVNVGTFDYAQNGRSPGTISLNVPPRDWSEAPTFLDAFGPMLALTNTSGTLGFEARATPVAKGNISGAVVLNIADFGFTAGALSMQAVSASIALDQVWPPRASSPQRIAFGRMVAGVPFTNGDITFALPGNGTAVVTQADIALAGGAVTGRDMVIPLDGRAQSFAMDVTSVDVGTLVSSFAADGNSATGKFFGRLPLRLDGAKLFIDRGRLTGRNGSIRYTPASPPAALAQGGGTILLQALADFRYDEIAASLNGDITKDLAIGLTLKGRNPGLYGGYPIEFNLNLDGPLNRLARDGLSGYRIPDDIKQRLEQQGLRTGSPN